jgi:capsular polysaccharide biosynthesis protein
VDNGEALTRVPVLFRRFQPQIGRLLRLITRLVGPVTRVISQMFGTRAIPRHATDSTSGYAGANPSAEMIVELVHAAENLRREVPRGLPADHLRFASEKEVNIPPAFVARVPGGRVVGDYGAIIAPGNTLLFDLSPYFSIRSPHHHPIFRRLRLPKPLMYDGTVAVLCARGDNNFYHFMLDVLPRLAMIERTRDLSTVDLFAVHRSLPFQRELLDMVHLPPERTLDASVHRHLGAELLVAPSLPALNNQTPRWVCNYLRSKLINVVHDAPMRQGPTRVYISRGLRRHSRKVTNEADVVDLLARWEVEAIRLEEMTIAEQIALFRCAELVIAPHGAGLANLVFCGAGTKVIEIFDPGYVNVCFWKLASQVEGVEYHYVLGEQAGSLTSRGDLERVSADITVNLERLERLLALAGF